MALESGQPLGDLVPVSAYLCSSFPSEFFFFVVVCVRLDTFIYRLLLSKHSIKNLLIIFTIRVLMRVILALCSSGSAGETDALHAVIITMLCLGCGAVLFETILRIPQHFRLIRSLFKYAKFSNDER